MCAPLFSAALFSQRDRALSPYCSTHGFSLSTASRVHLPASARPRALVCTPFSSPRFSLCCFLGATFSLSHWPFPSARLSCLPFSSFPLHLPSYLDKLAPPPFPSRPSPATSFFHLAPSHVFLPGASRTFLCACGCAGSVTRSSASHLTLLQSCSSPHSSPSSCHRVVIAASHPSPFLLFSCVRTCQQ